MTLLFACLLIRCFDRPADTRYDPYCLPNEQVLTKKAVANQEASFCLAVFIDTPNKCSQPISILLATVSYFF
ncbi:hypothetical protein [Methylotuvimicrobium sp.]|uniref:hypothetical protein n=1 Tax=Methylotuvimicrobium sp. TaxID=2822413 RepID=UPI003D6469F7